jgi:hypothetical protein
MKKKAKKEKERKKNVFRSLTEMTQLPFFNHMKEALFIRVIAFYCAAVNGTRILRIGPTQEKGVRLSLLIARY